MGNRIVDSFVRPIKFAFVLGINPNKREICRIITFCCEMLGGWHNLIIPTDGERITKGWEKFIEAGDPDLIIYQGQFSNLNAIQDQVRKLNIQPFRHVTLGKSSSFAKLEKNFTLPIDRIYDINITRGMPGRTDKGFAVARFTRHNPKVRLLGYFRFGLLSRNFEKLYKNRLSFASPMKIPNSAGGIFYSPVEITGSHLEYDEVSHFLYCFEESILGPHVLVVGDADSLLDCCLFWNWRALSCNEYFVEWIGADELTDLSDNSQYAVLKRDKLPNYAKLLTSVTLGTSSSATFQKTLSVAPYFQSKVTNKELIYKHVTEYDSDLPCPKYFHIKETIPVVMGNQIRIGRKIPPPYIHDDCVVKDLVTDINIRSHITDEKRGVILSPQNKVEDALNIGSIYTTIHRRITKSGFSFLLPSFLSQDMVSLSFKSDWEILSNICKSRGINIEESPASKHISKSLELSGGLNILANYYRNNIAKIILDSFLIPHSQIAKTLVGQKYEIYRRSYTLEQMKTQIYSMSLERLKKPKSKRWFHAQVDIWCDNWLEKGILISGFELNCPKCDFETWYPITQVGEIFTCLRCQSVVRRPLEAQIHYRLHESLYQAHKENMIVPILTLNMLRQKAQESFIYILPVRLEKGNPRSPEIDLIAIIDGEFVIGECKVPNHMSKKVYSTYSYLANILHATTILFSTISRKESCENIDCRICSKITSIDQYSDEIFSHGMPSDPTNWGDREKIRDFRVKRLQNGVDVDSICAFDLGLEMSAK